METIKNSPYKKWLLIPFVVLVTAGIILFIILPIINRQDGTEEPVTVDEVTQPDLDLLSITSTTEIQLGARTYIMPEGWNVSAKLASTTGTDYICEDCTLVLVTHDTGSAALYEIILSTPTAATREWAVEGEDEVTQASSLGMQFDLTGPKYQVEGAESSELTATDSFVQVSGCVPNDICVYAGRLDPTIERNQSQIDELKDFLSKLTVR